MGAGEPASPPSDPDEGGSDRGTAPVALSPPGFVGRQRELATITGALSGRPALVLLEGEAGIGKTRLTQACVEAPALRGQQILATTCPPLQEPLPLGPVVDGLRHLRPPVGRLQLSPAAGVLRPLFPEWAADLPPAPEPLDDQQAARRRLLAVVQELLRRLGVHVLVVEDAQWADAATVELLLALVSRPSGATGVLLTYRPEEVAAGSPLRRLSSRKPAGIPRTRVALAPLSPPETGQLVGSMVGAERISDEFAGLLHERTDGVPLAVVETVHLLADRRDLRRRGGQWARHDLTQLRVPPTVRDAILDRMLRLDPRTRRLLEAAAVLAEPANRRLLGTVAGLDQTAVRWALTDALRGGLLRKDPAGTFGFRHRLAERTTYQATPVPHRRLLHERAAQALAAADPPPVAQLARHCRGAGDLPAWRRYAEIAADVAIRSGNDHAAVALLLELLTAAEHPPERRVRLARKLGRTAASGKAALGDLAEDVVAALRSVLDRGVADPGQRGELQLQLGRIRFERGEIEAGCLAHAAAIPDLGDRPQDAARAMVYLAMPLTPDWPVQWHLEWLTQADALIPRIRSRSERRTIARSRTLALLLLGEPAGWQAAAELAADAAAPPRSREPTTLPRWQLGVGKLATVWGRYALARRLLDQVLEQITGTGYHRLLPQARLAVANLDWYTGDWSRIADSLRQVTDGIETEPLEHAEARLLHALLALAQGDRATAEPELRAVLAEFTRRRVVEPEALPAATALGRLHLSDGDVDEALRVTATDLELLTRKGLWLWATDLAPVRVEALLDRGAVADAEALVGDFAGWLHGRDAPAPAAALASCQAMLVEAHEGPFPAAARFAQAARAWGALPRPYDQLLAVERRARCLLSTGDSGRQRAALAQLRDAERRLVELGARGDADRVARTLRLHGVEVHRPWRGGQHGYGSRLSPRELEVVRLVAAGLTNRQVAEKLWLSPRTVAEHLGRACRKLGVSSRTGLAMAAAQSGLLTTGRARTAGTSHGGNQSPSSAGSSSPGADAGHRQ